MDETLIPRITEARQAGFSDLDIVKALASENGNIAEAMKQGFTPSEILGQFVQERTTGQKAIRGAEMVARGAIPPMALGTAGALAGAPLGPLGSATGFAVGSLAIPSADALISFYNSLVPEQERVEMPSTSIGRVLNKLGVAQPENRTERVLEAVGGAVAPVGGQIKAGQILVREGAPATKAVGEVLSAAPKAQIIAAAPAAAAGQIVGEETQNPLAAFLAAAATGAATGIRPKKMEIAPTAAELKTQASQAYKKSAEAGVLIKPQSIEDAGNSIISDISKKIVIDPEVDANAMAVQRRLKTTFEEPQSLEQLDLTRQFIRDATKGSDRSATYAKEALKQFDDYIGKIGAPDIVAGDSKTALSELTKARDLWKRSQKTQVIEDILQSAEVRAVNYSQSGMENALRRQLVSLADSSDMKFFTKAEQQAIRSAAKGGNLQNFLRWAGKLSPSSVVAGAGGAYIGASMLGPAGAVIAPIAGASAKYGATRLGLANIADLQNMMALGRQPQVLQAPFAQIPATAFRGLLSTSPE